MNFKLSWECADCGSRPTWFSVLTRNREMFSKCEGCKETYCITCKDRDAMCKGCVIRDSYTDDSSQNVRCVKILKSGHRCKRDAKVDGYCTKHADARDALCQDAMNALNKLSSRDKAELIQYILDEEIGMGGIAIHTCCECNRLMGMVDGNSYPEFILCDNDSCFNACCENCAPENNEENLCPTCYKQSMTGQST